MDWIIGDTHPAARGGMWMSDEMTPNGPADWVPPPADWDGRPYVVARMISREELERLYPPSGREERE